ncbi:MAG: hypothetical protein HKN82_12880 [Akkermansiaceae bacterium]|nr:hypothetical protein [Akkermansiaceae bacterium]NNM30738.1 hypothetical protein [Akkermansiaceae bacterium]
MNPQSTPGASPETPHPTWDAIAVRDLLRQAELAGRNPTRLLLGKREARAYHEYFAAQFGEEGRASVRDNYYLGLEVVELDVASELMVEGTKPRHAWDGDHPRSERAGALPPLWKEPPPRPGQAA